MNRALLLAISLLAIVPPVARAESDTPATAPAQENASALARLSEAAAAHPDDPDLALAWGTALAEAGRRSEAADVLTRVETRWPGRRPELPLRIVQLLYTAGRDEDALAAADALLAAEPDSGPAHLYRGLLLRRMDPSPQTQADAEQEFSRAAELAPALRSETLLLRALSRLEDGDDGGAETLLREVIAIDPTGETARRARLLLPQRSRVVDGPLISLGAYGGYQYDSNVTLDSGLDFGGVSTDKSDTGGVFGGSIVLRPIRGERAGLVLGYRYDSTLYQNITAYDFQSHLGFASIYLRTTERVTLRLDGVLIRGLLDDQRYVHSTAVRPNVFVSFGEAWGISRIFGEFELQDYLDDPFLPSLERSGKLYGGGIDHTFALPFAPWVVTTLHSRFYSVDTRGKTDFLGFDAAYDYNRAEFGFDLRFPLFWRISADMGLGMGWEFYRNPNVIDFLTDNGVGNLNPRSRRDFVVDGGISLVRPIFRGVSIELAWRATNRASNVDLYAYPRHVVGMYVRFQTD